MSSSESKAEHEQFYLARKDFNRLLSALHEHGYVTIGPTLRDQTIVLEEVNTDAELPVGWTESQSGGRYRVEQSEDSALFGFHVGPHSWKRYLLPSQLRLWHAKNNGNGMAIEPASNDAPMLAFVGVRPCDLHAIQIQDQILLNGPYTDPYYAAQREKTFIVAMSCTEGGDTCFCVSMDTGPDSQSGYDIKFVEVLTDSAHYFIGESASNAGRSIMADVPHRPATVAEIELAESLLAGAARTMGRTLETEGLKEMLYRNYEHPRWEQIAQRCLTCGNCTLVCPTCFCTTIEDVTALDGRSADRWRKLDSCFSVEFSHIVGGSVRATASARYRQWMMHKLATWVDQFGVFGCVGCGRCITWCPVGIDITEEAQSMRATETSGSVQQQTSSKG